MDKCNHEFEYKSEIVKCHDVNEGWFQAKRIIIFCKKCGKVSHDVVNSNSAFSQNYSKGEE